VAEQIVDVVREAVHVSPVGVAPGVLGTAVLQDRATDLLDLPEVARRAGVAFAPNLELSALGAEEVAGDAA
jgi:hypothetical protein